MADSNVLSPNVNTFNEQQDATIVIEDEQDAVSECGTRHEEGKPLKIIGLVQNLFVLGMSNLANWEIGLDHMKQHPDVTSHPVLLQVWFTLNKLLQLFQVHVYEKCGTSQKNFDYLKQEDYKFEELSFMFKSLLNKKQYKDEEYSFEICQTVMNVIRSKLLYKTDVPKQNKSTLKRKQKQTHSESKNQESRHFSRSPSPPANSGDESEDEDKFAKIFKTDKTKSVISQMFQYVHGNKRMRLTTPGEEGGTHLIKIEITDVKDLKSCASEKMYWTKVSKKGVFLLNTKNEEDGNMFKKIDSILVKAGEKVSQLKNIKKEELPAEFTFRKN